MAGKRLTMEDLHKLKIWWELAYKEGNSEIYNKCEETCYKLVGRTVEVYKCRKAGEKSWKELRMNDLCYVEQNYLDAETGILKGYYSKDNLIEICDENKIVACSMWKRLKGENPREFFQLMKQEYYEWFLYEPSASIYKSELSVNMFRVLDEEKKEEVLKVLCNEGRR